MRVVSQARVDRSFNRSRYNAVRVVDDFIGRLQDRTDPEGVVADWLGVIEETMQLASVGVWVR